MKKRLLWVGDAGVATGFARATHGILNTAAMQEAFDITVLGINYRGDPHPHPYPIYAALTGGDWLGVRRLLWMMDLVKPDVVVLQNDPWNIPDYMHALSKAPEYKDVPVIGIIAIDGLNVVASRLKGLAYGIFWTEFAQHEAQKGGYRGESAVIPLGVDSQHYTPGDRSISRCALGLPDDLNGVARDNAFLIGVVGRNQPRKRLDLSIAYFAEWLRLNPDVQNAFLYLHVAPTQDEGFQCEQLASYYGILHRLLVRTPEPWYGESEEMMRHTYRSFDAFLSTTQGEGFGLPAIEAMACGVPCILPNWSGYGDWANGAALLVECTQTAVTPGGVNAIGGIADRADTVRAIDTLYRSEPMRWFYQQTSRARAIEDRFQWNNIGQRYVEELMSVLSWKEAATV